MSKILLEAAQGKKTNKIPLWLMRQAGRYLPEYREIRKRHNTLEMFKTPSIAAEITLQPLKRFNLDGAILYADILLIPDAMGLDLFFVEKEGPRFSKTIRSETDLNQIISLAENTDKLLEKLSYVSETLDRVKQNLSKETTLLGFAGAPFTVASYMIEGGSSSKGDFFECKKFMFTEPKAFHKLMDLITNATIAYLKMQIKFGAEIVQLFESWSGALSPDQYNEFCLPYTKKIVDEIKKQIPVIHFFGQGASLIPEALKINPNVHSVDWRQDLSYVSSALNGSGIALQGNLDPLLLYAPQNRLIEKIEHCLTIGSAHPHGYIFNLGHGCTQHTPIENISCLVNTVNNFKS
ncbi:uroporphyrinogen decarboxylase [Silvanigrella paludirubra]|uniref:Uroporphyrinogen decarboxylase n=1 Tax=Silvanigrella paludirubra TaxID=2499159 RepID=A0A6N6VWH3_9BACT|nr:uroporphyrinogen decarboxylase [Silvanigrella paludirubra]KAB8040359.1 uroporphyrinogen decarboxylase [Silvanigrella paludirubra]